VGFLFQKQKNSIISFGLFLSRDKNEIVCGVAMAKGATGEECNTFLG